MIESNSRPRFPSVPGEPTIHGRIDIRAAEPDDGTRIMSAFSATFGVIRPSAYWAAKFIHEGRPLSVIAVDEADIVHAQFSAYPASLNVGPDKYRFLVAADVFARRSRRAIASNLFVRTMMSFHEMFGADASYVGIVGFPNATALGLYNHNLDIAVDRRLNEFVFEPDNRLGLLGTIQRFSRSPTIESSAIPADVFIDAVVKIALMRGRAGAVEFNRDVTWLRWRYVEAGRYYGAYEFHVVTRWGRKIGWIVTRQIDQVLYIVDWRFAPNVDAAIYGKVFAEVAAARKAINTIALMSTANSAEIGAADWRKLESTIPFAGMHYRPVQIPYNRLGLTYGDTDLR